MSDALDKLGLPGAVSGIPRLTTIAADLRACASPSSSNRDDGRPPPSRHLATTAIEAAQPGDVIVIEQRTGIDAACWGGNLSLGAKLRSVAGVIVDGPARDVDEARGYDFPVFARQPHRAHRPRPHRRGRHERADHRRRRARLARRLRGRRRQRRRVRRGTPTSHACSTPPKRSRQGNARWSMRCGEGTPIEPGDGQ